MPKLDLDREEREILVDILETRLADIRMEMGRASNLSYRETLRKRKRVLEKTVIYLIQETDAVRLIVDRKRPLA